jgi:hypothetical protein
VRGLGRSLDGRHAVPIGHEGGTGDRRAACDRLIRTRPAARRRQLLALLLLILPSALLLASPVQASMSQAERDARHATRLAERQAKRAVRLAEREALHQANQAVRQAKNEAIQQERTERWEAKHPNALLSISCEQLTVSYRAFPDAAGNTVDQQLTINHDTSRRKHSKFVFDGPAGTETIPLDGHAGRYQVDLWATYTIDGAKLHFDWYRKVICPPAPSLSIEKLQRIGSKTAYTPSPLTGEVGQTVEYEMIVENTGNIPLALSALSDPHCDAGTIAGGPGAAPLAIGATSTFTCTHVLTAADRTAGAYTNTASDTGTPVGEGSPVTGESNTVVVNIPNGGVQPEKTENPAGNPNSSTGPGPSSGVLALTGSSSAASPKSGVLASKTTAIPSLNGPHGCVRSSFKASVKSAGVSSVGFYLDRRKLKSMTSRSARNGRLTITIDPARLSVGPHKLLAKITMAPASAGAKARHATRSVTVLRCSSAVLTPRFTG